jgi:hypothetical protein
LAAVFGFQSADNWLESNEATKKLKSPLKFTLSGLLFK